MGRAICFTGHRIIASAQIPALQTELRGLLITAIATGFLDFYAGGALGWDTLCAEQVLELRNTYPGIALHLVLPCAPETQTARWRSARQVAAYDRILNAADSWECVGQDYTATCMRERNQRLVMLADCCICYYRKSACQRHGADHPHGAEKGHSGHQSGRYDGGMTGKAARAKVRLGNVRQIRHKSFEQFVKYTETKWDRKNVFRQNPQKPACIFYIKRRKNC